MASLNIPYAFTNGTPANATEVNSDFTAVKSFVEAQLVQVDGSVKAPTIAIADDAITSAKIAANAVGTSEIADDAVTADKVLDGATLPVNITGNAATANSATTAGSASTAGHANTAGSATTAVNLDNGAGSSTTWNGGTLNIYANPLVAQYAAHVHGSFWLFTVPSTSGNNVLMLNSDGQIKYRTLSPWSLQDMKEDIQPITNALDKVSSLIPRSFKFKEEVLIEGDDFDRFDRRTQTQYGFVIEEMLQSEVPDVVLHYQKDDEGELLPQSWKSHAVISLAVAAIQELSAKVDALQAEVDSLKNG